MRVLRLALSLAPLAPLGMVQWRCKTGPYACGFMMGQSGVTWHLGPVLVALAVVGVIAYRLNADRILYPLAGCWIGLVWYTLPIWLIHPPSHGGHCPNLPVICHDVPTPILGGLAYWLLPFGVWTLARATRHATASTPR